MKKLIAALLVLMLTLSLAACAPTGTVEGQTYRNADMGFGVTLADEWTMEGQLKEGDTTYDLYATNELTGETLNIILANDSDMDGKTDEEFLEENSKELAKELEDAGYNDVQMNVTAVSVAGRECKGYTISVVNEGITIYLTMVMWHEGSYVAVMTTASSSEYESRAIYKDFFPAF